ncbi:MAG TPA: DUF2309 domain-containing protein [Planctomycetaceae bacterium]|nr:DUF2309 domain-containing protein [Planctomycetaceae bacterium]
MHTSATCDRLRSAEGDGQERLDQLRNAIEHAAHLLPAQGPITVFIHHNTLHALEDLPFTQAVAQAARTYGCQPYLSEDRYREELSRGRIRTEDLFAVLLDDLGEEADRLIGFLGTRFHVRLSMLQYPLRLAPTAELKWLVAEADALLKFRDDAPAEVRQRTIEQTRHWVMRDLRNGRRPHGGGKSSPESRARAALAELSPRFRLSTAETWNEARWEAFCLHALWRVCQQGVHGVRSFGPPAGPGVRHRDALLAAGGEDSDRLVDELLIRFCAAFLDQGLANWALPGREAGFYRAFCRLYGQRGGPPERWLRGLRREIARGEAAGFGPLESIEESLELLGVSNSDQDEYLSATLLALRGWAGMLWQMEVRGDRVAHAAPRGSLVEFVAVRLILERLALAHVGRESLGYTGPLAGLAQAARARTAPAESVSIEQRTFLVFQLAQVLGWTPADLFRLSKDEWSRLVEELETFSSLERRRVFHVAYERHYRDQTLDAITIRARRPAARPARPRFQAIFCIDEREESFRRHLEERAGDVETFGAAGFFAVPMYYRGIGDAHFVPLCPVVIRPRHYVRETVVAPLEDLHRRRARTRRALGAAWHQVHVGSRSFTAGALLAALVGPLATFPLVARILFPRLTARLRRLAGELIRPPTGTRLQLERIAESPGPAADQSGFRVDEMAESVERLLREIGLTSRFARLIVVAGHGSSSLNNPHGSAYNCGACGGSRGGPNARAFALMANDSRVRQRLAERGLSLPDETVFLGAYHNTCNDSVSYLDLDRLPASHAAEFEEFRRDLDIARELNAHERCRRFESAPLALSGEDALRHVERRAEDLAQPRPECGHATNALCVVGRRARTRGLFLDRRAFLASYDPTQDDGRHTLLTRILAAVVPVCAGISLEYYFSYVDPEGWGCGTKLPHNIVALLGVMDGAASDLRPGLPWQMVEIHEPLRPIFLVETTPVAMHELLDRNADLGRLFRNGWAHLATLDPDAPEIHVFQDGRFERHEPALVDLPEVESSSAWYRGWRDHLGCALVSKGLAPAREPMPRGRERVA